MNPIRDFFLKEEESLKVNYPGISLNRLQTEYEVYRLRFGTNARPQKFIEKLKDGVPLEYITGRSYFYKAEFVVNEATLIPRSETELLVEMALKEIKGPVRMVDIGTGSGCIPLSIAMESSYPLEVLATDISEDALEVAKLNSYRLEFTRPKSTTLDFLKTDRLKGVPGKFQLIVSNPPYIKEGSDRSLVHDQVDKYEPHMALYLKSAEYEQWFSEFFEMVVSSLDVNGVFLMEGHENHLNDLAPLAEQFGLRDVKILPDLSGSHRFLRGIKLES